MFTIEYVFYNNLFLIIYFVHHFLPGWRPPGCSSFLASLLKFKSLNSQSPAGNPPKFKQPPRFIRVFLLKNQLILNILIHLLIHSFIHSLIYLFIHLLIHLLIYLLIHSLIDSLIDSLTETQQVHYQVLTKFERQNVDLLFSSESLQSIYTCNYMNDKSNREMNKLHTFGHHHSWNHQRQSIGLKHNKRIKQFAIKPKFCSLWILPIKTIRNKQNLILKFVFSFLQLLYSIYEIELIIPLEVSNGKPLTKIIIVIMKWC